MRLLAIDTTTEKGGVAVGQDGELEGMVCLSTPLRYSETLLPALEFLLQTLDGTLEEVGLLVVASGPGSFTGVRIGLAVAKALGQSRDIPGLTISTLEALSFSLSEYRHRVAVLLDAGRSEVYAGLYEWREGGSRALLPECVGEPGSWLSKIPQDPNLLIAGSGAAVYSDLARRTHPEAQLLAAQPCLLEALIALGSARRKQATSVEQLAANYIRPSDAELSGAGR